MSKGLLQCALCINAVRTSISIWCILLSQDIHVIVRDVF